MALHFLSLCKSRWMGMGLRLILLASINDDIFPVAFATAVVSPQNVSASASCRYIPGDAGWPAKSEWDALNSTVDGRLIATDPIAHVCHDPTFDNATCNVLKADWGLPDLQVSEPAEILAPYFQNQTCDPYTAESTACTLGNYVSYSINVTSASDAAAGLSFAQKNNVRLVIKNTGHDFYGKSTGKGGLALWTHNLQSMEIISSYSSSYYNGSAIKLGAGVMGGVASNYANEHGYRLITGGCPTVGVAGGFTQGGGLSLLSGLYGLGADNVLEWEVVTADGQHVIATPTQFADLYWAMSGGGGGTYAVAISMTVRLFEDGPVGRASFNFTVATAGSEDAFWGAVDIFHSHLQPILDNGGIDVEYGIGSGFFETFVITAPNRTSSEVAEILSPMTSALNAAGLSPTTIGFTTGEASSYQAHYNATLAQFTTNASSNSITSGRFITRSNLANNVSGISQAFRNITSNGDFELLCSALNANALLAPVSENAVQPTWRDAAMTCTITGAWDWSIPFSDMLQRQADLTSTYTPAFEAATPNSGTYLNEGNFQQPDWQDVFYGTNYEKLRAIKKVYDDSNLFYGLTAVGSEAWAADSEGRLCKTGV